MSYLHDFQLALDRNRRFGLPVPAFQFQDFRYLKTKRAAQIPAAIQQNLGFLSNADLVAQCFSIHYRLAEVISGVLNAPAFLTIGYIGFGGEFRFRKSEEELEALLSSGLGDETLGAHAWLTLPSMEIMDFSLPTSMAVLNGWSRGHGEAITSHADELEYGLTYHPQIIGEQYLWRTGAIRLTNLDRFTP